MNEFVDAIPETIPGLLRWGAQRWPERLFVTNPDGSEWNRKQALVEAESAAASFCSLGIGRNDRVVVMLPNSADWLRCWWGLAMLGAIIVPFNPALRGNIFKGIFQTIDPKMIVVERGAEDLFDEEQLRRTRFVDEIVAKKAPALETWPEIDPADPAAIIMTSGTTGPSKGSLMPNRQLTRQSGWLIEKAGVGEDDVFMADMPLFHLSGLSPISTTMVAGGRFVLRVAPAVSTYWETARDHGATWSYIVGTMSGFLTSKPERPAEKEHSLRFVLAAPLPADIEAFKARFNLGGIGSSYGMSEAGIVVVQSPFEPMRPNSAGRGREGYEFRLVDAEGKDVELGQPGVLLVRSLIPNRMTLGYFGNEEATRNLLQDGWLNTGDILSTDEDGYFYFQDRAKDSLRRRGENISSFEVEREVQSHPDVQEAACVAYPSEYGGDDEVKVFVVLREDAFIDWPELVQFLAARMPYFMVPRYFEPIDDLPKTPTNRVQKHLLREKGNGPSAWDREAAGIIIGRDGKVKQSA
ncbi:AMP-binding protein [Sphingobium sp. V4]|uniref:AMP-binding protein n=1 Tax=Sphingobium sp. V4 TaxID=3038927 RepID=UPI002557CC1E|nr:AMP-binding protein [Sphingobium sp. V4]WIW89457.1 AMP-binding protein [Sphingobium sp. V4]